MLVDAFLFNNELDLLELRLSILDSVMDHFVVIESDVEFSGRKKPLFFAENKERFASWNDKITHYIVRDTPNSGPNRWVREYHQRDAIIRGLKRCKSNDVVFMGDIDEIPDLDAVKAKKQGAYRQIYSMYYANAICEDENWVGTTALYYYQYQQIGIQNVRNNRYNMKIINPGGWHFAYMMSVEQMHQKLGAFAHSEWDTPETHAIMDARVANLNDLFGTHKKPMKVINMDTGYFPQYLKDNKKKYAKFLKA